MRRPGILLAAALWAAIPALCLGAEGDELGDPLSLESAIAFARRHNPEVRAAEARWRAAQARPPQAGSLPDPMLDLGYHNESFSEITLGESQFSWVAFGASQEVPFPGKLSLKRAVAEHSADEVAAESRRVELEVVARVKVAYAEYAHLYELLHLLQRNQALLEKLTRTAEAKYAVGQGIQQDVLRAQVEQSLLVDRETTLLQRQQSQAAELNAILGRPAEAPLGAAEHLEERRLTRSQQELMTAATARAPALQTARSRVAGSETTVALAEKEYLPDFVVRAAYNYKGGLEPEWEVGVGVKLPLYFASKQRAGVEEAAAMLAEARAMREDAARTVESRVRDLYTRAQASERLIALYHSTIIPQARLALESASSAYAVGKVDFLTLLNSYTVSLEYEMRYHEELSSFQKATAELEAVVGEPVEG
jgi:cobalt-zinc-cadmium efflux system outer membrane protein